MTRPFRTLVGFILPIVTIVVFVVLLAFSLMQLADIERDMRIEANQNMLWVISRAHIASLKLGDIAAGRAAGTVEQAELDRRHNVFLSRLALLDDGPQRRQMEILGFGDELDRQKQAIEGLGATFNNPLPADVEAIRAELGEFETMLGQAANRAMIAEWDELGSKLDTSREQLWHIIISLIGISLAGATICLHFLLAIRDARQRARLLDKEKAFSELLIGSSGSGIVAMDLERRCTVWNEAAERLFDLPASKALGATLGDVSGFFQIDRIDTAIGNSLSGEAAALFDQPFFLPDRPEPLYVDLRCFSLFSGERIIGSILLVSDVTERRAVQSEIEKHRDHLEDLVQARTRELDAALDRERATVDLYRNFGTMISHQFRTPLAIVDSALQRLMRRSDILTPREVLERGGKARQAIARLIRLVESTLDAARLDAGQIEIRSEPCNLGDMVAEICSRQTELSGDRVFELEPSAAAIALCDPVHAENILVNLLSNAIKYSPADSPVAIRVSCRGDMVECAVTSHGDPMDASEREAVFERYFRGENADGHPGVGIGLYMARTLARMQGGDVRLDECNKSRVTFTLSLPRMTPGQPTAAAVARVSEPA